MKYTITDSNNTIHKTEKEYKAFFTELGSHSVTADDIKASAELTARFAEESHRFIDKVLLCSRTNSSALRLLQTVGYERDMACDDLAMHLVMKKLDCLPLHDPDHIIPLIVQICHFKLVDIVRKEVKMQPDPLDDLTYASLASDEDIENDFARKDGVKEHCSDILKLLSFTEECSRFELLSFLATKVITDSSAKCTKPSALAEMINRKGLTAVSEDFFHDAADELDIPYNSFFKNFKSDKLPVYDKNVQTLSKLISHATNNCVKKMRRKADRLGITYTR
ncbi:hypothetical protein [uncultured Eubacterium sp.]|uniref:hypothetical protein n=1 Tax=uncultured Eubacterium sp. TaxID=165185 RepID=UPI0025F55623|nr:hypothetical protein [uncultured Eubacterium sp.]